jgi:hypothetical protein
MEVRLLVAILAVSLASAAMIALLLLRYKLKKEAEPGSNLKLTDLLLMGSSSWAKGTNMDVEWRQSECHQPAENQDKL